MPEYSDDLLTPEEADLVIGAIPLQALPEPWYVGDCVKYRAMVVDCCDQCERCRDCCRCWRPSDKDIKEFALVIPLTQGKVAIVDLEDYNDLSRFNWHAKAKELFGEFALLNFPQPETLR